VDPGALPPDAWRSPEQLVELGFARARVVMANEAHHGFERCTRTREVGRRLVVAADTLGVRHLAMEALLPGVAEAANADRRVPDGSLEEIGYLAQPEMRVLVQAALDRGWTLWPYEAEPDAAPAELRDAGTMSHAFTNWREEQQARRLVAVLEAVRPEERLLVWCGNSHALKIGVPGVDGGDWVPMGVHFTRLAGAEAFVIDQTVTVRFPHADPGHDALVERLRPVLHAFGGTAGVLRADLAAAGGGWPGIDALVASLDNSMS
jgi:hypothetical protein